MEAIVLAGGFGTRLAHIVSDVPKPMAPVCGRPFLRYILDDLQRQGIERVVLAVGYKREAICGFFGESYRGMELIYSAEETPLLTGGAIKKALRLCRDNRVFVINGDTYFAVNLREMVGVSAPVVVAVRHMTDFTRYGTVMVEKGRIVAFQEKRPCHEGLINGGIYLLDRLLLEEKAEDKFSFEEDVLEAECGALRIAAYESGGCFIDIGVPEDYVAAQKLMRAFAPVEKAVFFDRDGTINVDMHYLHRPEDLRFIDGMPQFIKKWNDWGYRVIVATNQAGIARGIYTEDDMRALHRYMNEQLKEYGAHIDAFYFCPHHPDFTGPCRCRKPEPGMLERAVREFDLDPAQCLLFGDQPWDVEAGRRCGIWSAQVTSG